MIVVTRLNGPPLALNCDLIERIEQTPDTVLTLVDGTKYVVQETIEQIIERVREFRASVVVMAQRIDEADAQPSLRVVKNAVDITAINDARQHKPHRDDHDDHEEGEH